MNTNCCRVVGSSGHTDTEVTASRPDIIINNKKEQTCILIDVAIPADRSVMQKEADRCLPA
jgi:hypothetical protein